MAQYGAGNPSSPVSTGLSDHMRALENSSDDVNDSELILTVLMDQGFSIEICDAVLQNAKDLKDHKQVIDDAIALREIILRESSAGKCVEAAAAAAGAAVDNSSVSQLPGNIELFTMVCVADESFVNEEERMLAVQRENSLFVALSYLTSESTWRNWKYFRDMCIRAVAEKPQLEAQLGLSATEYSNALCWETGETAGRIPNRFLFAGIKVQYLNPKSGERLHVVVDSQHESKPKYFRLLLPSGEYVWSHHRDIWIPYKSGQFELNVLANTLDTEIVVKVQGDESLCFYGRGKQSRILLHMDENSSFSAVYFNGCKAFVSSDIALERAFQSWSVSGLVYSHLS